MTWFKLDDKSAFHRKVLKAGNEAWGALCRAGAVSSGEETDGRVTLDTCLAIAPKRIWDRLVDAELVDRIEGSTDLLIHDFLDWNPSADEVQSKRAARAAAGRRGGISSGHSRSNDRSKYEAIASPERSNCLPDASPQNEPPSRPVPSRPDPEREPPVGPPRPVELAPPPASPTGAIAESVSEHAKPQQTGSQPPITLTPAERKRATRCPSSADSRAPAWLETHRIPALSSKDGLEVAKMLDHFASASGARGTKLDWLATWRNWSREAERRLGGQVRAPWQRPVQPGDGRTGRIYVPPTTDNFDEENPF